MRRHKHWHNRWHNRCESQHANEADSDRSRKWTEWTFRQEEKAITGRIAKSHIETRKNVTDRDAAEMPTFSVCGRTSFGDDTQVAAGHFRGLREPRIPSSVGAISRSAPPGLSRTRLFSSSNMNGTGLVV